MNIVFFGTVLLQIQGTVHAYHPSDAWCSHASPPHGIALYAFFTTYHAMSAKKKVGLTLCTRVPRGHKVLNICTLEAIHLERVFFSYTVIIGIEVDFILF